MAHYFNITQEEMESHLLPQGFKPMQLAGTVELVYGKVVRRGDTVVSMRVYTGINPDGNSRDVGKDAIRVDLFWRPDADTKPYMVGGSRRVNRVTGWRKNLQNRIDTWLDALGPPCPKCGAPMVERSVKKEWPNKGKKFHSCVTWPKTKCEGKVWPDHVSWC